MRAEVANDDQGVGSVARFAAAPAHLAAPNPPQSFRALRELASVELPAFVVDSDGTRVADESVGRFLLRPFPPRQILLELIDNSERSAE